MPYPRQSLEITASSPPQSQSPESFACHAWLLHNTTASLKRLCCPAESRSSETTTRPRQVGLIQTNGSAHRSRCRPCPAGQGLLVFATTPVFPCTLGLSNGSPTSRPYGFPLSRERRVSGGMDSRSPIGVGVEDNLRGKDGCAADMTGGTQLKHLAQPARVTIQPLRPLQHSISSRGLQCLRDCRRQTGITRVG